MAKTLYRKPVLQRAERLAAIAAAPAPAPAPSPGPLLKLFSGQVNTVPN